VVDCALRETADLQASDVREVMHRYLDEQIDLAKVSEMLGLSLDVVGELI
jgi:hypothetical protein